MAGVLKLVTGFIILIVIMLAVLISGPAKDIELGNIYIFISLMSFIWMIVLSFTIAHIADNQKKLLEKLNSPDIQKPKDES